jgi:D-glycero-D-manno-heptose 1,7-bisphosphate phosphatase
MEGDKAVFIDRDGTINKDQGYVYRIEDFLFLPGTFEAFHRLNEERVEIYIITNQSGIGMGAYTEKDFKKLTDYMMGEFKKQGIEVGDVLYCPHHPEGTVARYRKTCSCRKPEPGMLEEVLRRKNFQKKNLALIGDKNSDIEAGRRLGIRTYLVETGYGFREKATTAADEVARDLRDAVEKLLKFWAFP